MLTRQDGARKPWLGLFLKFSITCHWYVYIVAIYQGRQKNNGKGKKKRIEGISVDVANCNDCWNLSSLEIWGEWNRGKDAWGRAGAVKSNTRKIPQK